MSGSLNGLHQLALMLCTGTRNTFGNNLALLRDKTLKSLLIFVVNENFVCLTEAACSLFGGNLFQTSLRFVMDSASITLTRRLREIGQTNHLCRSQVHHVRHVPPLRSLHPPHLLEPPFC